MLAGEPPFTGPTAQAILARRLTDPVPPLRTVRETVPAVVEQAITKALAKVPADRFATATQFAEALARPTQPSREVTPWQLVASWPHFKWAAPALVVMLVGAAVWVRTRPRGSLVVPAASVIAVLPPVPTSPDTALSTLGRNLVWTLTASLNGVGELKTIDALTVLAQTLNRSDLPLDEAASLGRRLGASGVVHGTLTRDGPKVRLDLGLYDARDAAPVARAFVTASPEDLNALTDSAAWALLGQVWRSGVPPSPSLAAVTTRSLPALRAFLDGERGVTEYRWPDAAEAFGRAIQEDSTFWLAYWRYAWAKGWQGEGLDSATASVARAHLEDLPERERMFAEIWRTPAPASFDSARRLTGRFPDYWPGWLALGDELFHNGPGFGHSPEEAREAFERALALYPHLGPAWDHMAWIATFIRDTALYKRVAQEVPWVGGAGLDLMRGRPLGRPAMDSALVELLGWRDPQVQEMQAAAWLYDSPAVQMELSQRLLAAGALPMAANAHRLGLAVGWAARGAWDSAMVAIDRYAARSPDSTAALEPYQFAVLGVWLGGLSPEQAASRRTGVQAQRLPARSQPVLLWLDGLLAAVRRDSMGIRAAQRAIGPPDTSYAGCFARSLAAFDLALRGRRREAGESLAAMAWVSQWASGGDAGRGAIFRGVNRMAAARWLAAEGDTDQARRLLLWRYGLPGPYARYWLEIHVLNSLTSLEAARIEAARGNVAKARHYYEDFLRTYDRPVPALAHVVTEAREALGRLEGKAIGEGRPRP
jgi:TolB-like protein